MSHQVYKQATPAEIVTELADQGAQRYSSSGRVRYSHPPLVNGRRYSYSKVRVIDGAVFVRHGGKLRPVLGVWFQPTPFVSRWMLFDLDTRN